MEQLPAALIGGQCFGMAPALAVGDHQPAVKFFGERIDLETPGITLDGLVPVTGVLTGRAEHGERAQEPAAQTLASRQRPSLVDAGQEGPAVQAEQAISESIEFLDFISGE